MTDTRSPAARRELGDFLRSRRERLSPEKAGLPPTSRRRTPGLRREEVAVLAGVGVTWYTWLEQGRSINVSTQVLVAVGRALQLDGAERQHLHRLAGVRAPAVEPVGGDLAPAETFQPVLDKLHPYPACLQTPLYDVVAYNRAYRFLFTDLDRIPPGERNCAMQFFTDPGWRSRYVDDDIVAARMVATMRAVVAADAAESEAAESRAAAMVGELRARSGEFARLWSRHDILPQHYETKRLKSPLVGPLHLTFVTTNVGETGNRMVVMTPVDEATSERLTRLAALTAPSDD
ncbi:XRE family transcriptional regulator [Streptomyces triticagri]|uniref:XRE family transcriptional regulator n=1 Tax=Streptomyces triticagri TaxID=2293568 RepID=A0A372MAA4_9ACTN|nr:helix-turn-helix transcriptional regulator [Streptomyces triticagri]RFU87872.1 XRE family transcriptional regulator [Streptomyces triticagri]